ncbi:MAG: winged helix-turn-helix domain-containing protein [Woeseiaceae bacterium]|nr:winged helix-turn-helix domain-containing protein [Woeseiaceae bacterium]
MVRENVELEDFRIGEHVVRPSRGLVEGPQGFVRIKPKSMAVLCKLATHPERVVSRNDVLDAIWPNGDVSDDVLTHAIVELRKAFGDSAKDSRIIETIPRKGVRLIPKIEPIIEQHREPPRSRSRRRAIIAAAPAVVILVIAMAWSFVETDRGSNDLFGIQAAEHEDMKAIAVLPFVDMSPSGDKEFIADGLTEELINRLTQIEELLVTGRTSSFFFKNRNEDLREIGRQLSVQYILEGSVRSVDTDLRITAQLIDVNSGFHMWSRSFDAQSEDIFEIQSAISESVAEALSVELGLAPYADMQGGTTNYAAYEAAIRGDSYFHQLNEEALDRALAEYNEAVRIDPEFAFAWIRIANVHLTEFLVSGRSNQAARQPLADQALERARQIAPESAPVLLSSAFNEANKYNWRGALEYVDQATELSGRDMRMSEEFAEIGLKLGFPTAVLSSWHTLQRIDPLITTHHMLIAHAYLLAGEYGNAADQIEQGWARGGKDSFIANEGVILALTLDEPAMIELWLARALEHVPANGVPFLESMQETLGDREAAVARLYDWYEQGMDYDYYVLLWAAYYSEDDLALMSMRRGRDLWVFWLGLLQDLRARDEFKEILRDTGVVDAMREFGWNEYCEPVGRSDFNCR